MIDWDVDAYGYEELPTPHTERAQSHQDFAVPGSSRVYSVPATETRTRESRFSQVDGWDPRDRVRGPSRRRRESFRSSGADSYSTGVPVDGSESHSSIRVMPTHTIERERTRTRPSPTNVVTPGPERYEGERRASPGFSRCEALGTGRLSRIPMNRCMKILNDCRGGIYNRRLKVYFLSYMIPRDKSILQGGLLN